MNRFKIINEFAFDYLIDESFDVGELFKFISADEGDCLACCEDVGRHNAVDKVVGTLLYKGGIEPEIPEQRPVLLAVSGRASFEIVQKAIVARIPVVASVSAASSLAVDLAGTAGLSLVGFVRGVRFNLYTHSERIISA